MKENYICTEINEYRGINESRGNKTTKLRT